MPAYYNEIDPYAAKWLRALIAGGLIPKGDVDERSILDVRAADLAGYDQCHFFAGIGGWPYALALAGWRGRVRKRLYGHPSMIKELLHAYGSNRRRTWDYDRSGYTGASEVGQCLRKVKFGKWRGSEPDPEYIESWGYALRGSFMEDHYWVPALRASLPPGALLRYAGADQMTLALGSLSATPDGCLVGLPDPDGGGGGVLVECKSIDPRSKLTGPKPEHEFQVQVGMGILRRSDYPECPDWAVISYIDASDWSRVSEFAIKYSDRVFAAAQERAQAIASAASPDDLPAEGKIAGGRECHYCAYQRQCGDGEIATMPEGGVRLHPEAVKELKGLRDAERRLALVIEDNRATQALAHEAIKQFLRQHNARAHKEVDGSWSVQWSVVAGRRSLDTRAVEAAGINLEPYQKEGKPSERLTIT